ncbi:MAG TPA: 3-dehydroquinate synthase [Gammaproteobacteria bacterium]|nr:3-dehydroquinate synthase [Gammaproteobacteria bacterium]
MTTSIHLNDIHIDSDLIRNVALFNSVIDAKNILVVTDTVLKDLHLPYLLQSLRAFKVDVVTLPAGEEHKNWAAMETILAVLAEQHHDRDSMVLSFGGGVIGDLAGFAASIYMRGIKFLQIPTTLLSQVDAGVGGKTGCNFLGFKNLIGTFHTPCAVIMDVALLNTLPDREYVAGLAEVVKYGVICDADFFSWLEANKLNIKLRDAITLRSLVTRCCELKQAIVSQDMHDLQQRMILNFGHSFGHAIEAATGYKQYLHGEAVAIGMLLAARLAVTLELLQQEVLDRLVILLEYFGLNLKFNAALCDSSLVLDYMRHDKKVRGGKLRIILPCALGKAVVMPDLDFERLEDLMQSYV